MSLREGDQKKHHAVILAVVMFFFFVMVLVLPVRFYSPEGSMGQVLAATLHYGWKFSVYVVETGNVAALGQAHVGLILHAFFIVTSLLVLLLSLVNAYIRSVALHEYGEGEFANGRRVKSMQLDGKLGPLLGTFGGKELRPRHTRHNMIVAPNRSGKTAGVIVPSILSYPGSAVIIDPKGELYGLTSKARQKFGPVHVIDWADPESPGSWSPVAHSALPENEIELERLAERVATMFFPPSSGAEKFWADTARRNFSALLMFEIYESLSTQKEPHIGQIASRLSSYEINAPAGEGAKEQSGKNRHRDPFGDHLVRLAATADLNGYPRRIVEDLRFFAQMDTKERASHLSTLITGIQLLRLQAVQKATSTASFSFSDLRKDITTVYIRFPQQDAKAFGPLTALMFEALFAFILDNPQQKGESPIWIAADEFASLPKIPLLLDFMAKGAGNGAHISIVVQDFAQIEEVYGRTGLSTILTNCTYTVAFGQNNVTTARMLSDLVGKKTRSKVTHSGTWLRPFAPTMTETTEGVPVITPEDWGRIPFGKHILLAQGHAIYPVLCTTPMYYKNKRYLRLTRAV